MKLGKASWALICVLAGALLTVGSYPAQPARAATVLAMDLPDLVADADVIALGRAERRAARWAKYGKLIVTDVEFSVLRPLKGDTHTGDTLVITRLGGALEELALTVPGAAQFDIGQTALVFLRRRGDELQVVGMAQGVMPVSGQGTGATVQTVTGQVERVQPTGDKAAADAAGPSNRPLQAVLSEIATLVGRAR